MNRAETRELATDCRDLLIAGDAESALARLRPIVATRTPFPLLDGQRTWCKSVQTLIRLSPIAIF